MAAETDPLLPSPPTARFGKRLLHEIEVLVLYARPVIGTQLLQYSLLFVTIVSVGHIGTIELAGASLANLTVNVLGLSVIQGFSAALDTLCPQSFTSTPTETSLHALRTVVILFALMVPMVALFWNSEYIFLHIGQDPRVAAKAALSLKVSSFYMPAYIIFDVNRKWLQAQGIMTPMVYALFVAAPLNALLSWALVWGPEPIRLGFVGAPLSTCISFNLMSAILLAYSVFRAPRTAWGGFTWAMFRGLGVNIKLGLAGFAMVASEWWCWEIVGLCSSILGPEYLAAQSVLSITSSIMYQIPFGLSMAAAVRVGNLLGAALPRTAQIASRVALVSALGVATFNSAFILIFRTPWLHLFVSAPEVIAIAASIMPLVGVFQIVDGLNAVSAGLLRGTGKPVTGALINLLGYYIIGIPTALTLAFSSRFSVGFMGLWIGLTLGITVACAVAVHVVLQMDWYAEACKAKIRMGLAENIDDASRQIDDQAVYDQSSFQAVRGLEEASHIVAH